jgi:hypothetical protein
MEQIGAFWNASRCQPQVLRESLQAGPASADAIGDKSKTGRQGIMQHGATNEHQNVILARRSPSPPAASRRMKIGFVRLLDSALVRPKLQSAND